MDKKNTIIGVMLLVAAFAIMFTTSPDAPEPIPPDPEPREEVPREPFPERAPREERLPEAFPEAEAPPPERETTTGFPSVIEDDDDEQFVTLANGFIDVQFTTQGGAVRRIALRQYEAVKGVDEPFVFNEYAFAPALSLEDFPGADRHSRYRLVSESRDTVVFSRSINDRLEVRRTYSLAQNPAPDDPDAYIIRHETTFHNRTEQDLLVDSFGINLGTAAPPAQDETGFQQMYLNFGHYDGNKARFIGRNKFQGGGFLSWIGVRSGAPTPVISEPTPLVWASVKNQFFTSILTPAEQSDGYLTRAVELPPRPGERRPQIGVTGSMLFDLRGIPASDVRSLEMDYYVGPKEYRRLERLEERQDLVMQFGFFGFISKILLVMMTAIYNWIPNYGVAIILTTVVIKTLLWPLTAQAARSSKRMQKISEPMKILREKYKDNPQKMQLETMKLFRENKVNPLGGCLPIFIQLPIFFALFRMLQSASELRFAEFLWVGDLSASDTLFRVMGIPINVMPILMGVTMFWQMRMMPTATINPMQQKIFMFMPFFITAICYNFSSGLTLYWTVNNLLTILQQFITNRRKDDDPVVIPASLESEDEPSKPRRKKRRRGKK